MAGESLIEQLLDEISESGRTPEEVCGAFPELLPEVRRRWRRMRAVEEELDAFFPMSGHGSGADISVSEQADAEVPRIPGYDVEAVLGRGGMGIVYKARHRFLDRPVALKMLLAGAYAGPPERERFRREAEAVARLRHPNVVPLYDADDLDGRPYFTMEFVEGGSLAEKITGMPQPSRQSAALLAQVAGAVHFAHSNGIVHRDLKPANILLATDPRARPAGEGPERRGGRGLPRRCQAPRSVPRFGRARGP
jgi:serine/threonine-protein kinase